MKKYLDKKVRRWVLGTVDQDGKCWYLFRKPQSADYQLVPTVDLALKAASESTAELMLEFYYAECGNQGLLFVPIPIEITYEIIEEEKEI